MTSDLQFTPSTYFNRVTMSEDNKFLLVEGSEDKRLFKYFKQEFSQNNREWDSLIIHCAEEFKSIGGKGCREIIEEISEKIFNNPNSNKFVGFVDREFREFELNDSIVDLQQGHKVIGRLVWSRGHSIENYYFDYSILKIPLRDFSVSDCFDEALDLFSNYLTSSLKNACAASLAGRECQNRLDLVKSSLDWKTILLKNEKEILIDTDQWGNILSTRNNAEKCFVKKIIDSFLHYYDIVNNSDINIVRWLCHGHIGLAFIWGTYGRCIYEVCKRKGVNNPETHVSRVLRAEESVRFNACASAWVYKVLSDDNIFPKELFELLALPLTKKTKI
jgi:hypothetical protein